MSKHLHIVIPCSQSAPIEAVADHITAYFKSDPASGEVAYSVTFVRQEGPAQPNIAALKNAGFLVGARRSHYTCFNEPGFLPVWADYSWSDAPVSLVGRDLSGVGHAHSRPPTLRGHENLGVLLTPNEVHLLVDGYSNHCASHISSASNLQDRYREAGVALEQRLGTFLIQSAAQQFLRPDEVRSPTKVGSLSEPPRDGLSTLAFQIVDHQPLAPHHTAAQVITVRFSAELTNPSLSPTASDDGGLSTGRMTGLLQKWLISAARKKNR